MNNNDSIVVRIFFVTVFFFGFSLQYAHADFTAALSHYNDKQYDIAMTEFRRSAVLGHKPSQFNIGVMYFRGEGVKQDFIESYAWLAISATDGNAARVQIRDTVMSKMDEQQKDAAIDRMSTLATEIAEEERKLEPVYLSEAQCQFHLKIIPKSIMGREPPSLGGNGYTTDIEFSVDKLGFIRDYSLTVPLNKDSNREIYDWFKYVRYEPVLVNEKPIEVTSASLRYRFLSGRTFKDQDAINKYVDELRAKAKTGNSADMYNFAYIGSLVKELNIDKQEANRWFLNAAQAGNLRAQYEIGKALFRGDACQRDTGKALRWLTLAAEENSPDAQYFLGMSLLNTDDSPQSKQLAIDWLRKAADGHLEKAIARLAWILATDKDEAIRNPSKALTLAKEIFDNYPDLLRSNETMAAALAANGMYDEAVKAQLRAIKEARTIQYPLTDPTARLNAYKNKTPWIE